jgi:hypothetical protein
MHPYRTAELSAPSPPPTATRRTRRLLAALALGTTLFSLVASLNALAIARGVAERPVSTVERSWPVMPPQVLIMPPPPAAPPEPRAVAYALPTWPAGLLEASEPQTHDPDVLRARARALDAAGLVRLSDVRFAAAPSLEDRPLLFHATPVNATGRTDGVELGTIPPHSLLARAGLAQGDIVLSVNGYPAAGTEWVDHVFGPPERAGQAVVELVRAKRRFVLMLHWPPAP